MPKVFLTGLVFLLLLGAGYGLATIQAARSIPWDCSDWQAFAHADRTTAILESLAENRGKTLYCGVDQSDTFAKAETWEAGKDRNERDDTVYFGERGQFRGFIAAQEGWLTEGESGVTGVSIDRIFEFPREKRRVKRVKRFPIANTASNTDSASCGQVGGLICSEPGGESSGWRTVSDAKWYARRNQTGITQSYRRVDWRTQVIGRYNLQGVWQEDEGTARPDPAGWLALAETAATAACRARGARYAAGSAALGPGHNDDPGLGGFYNNQHTGDHLGWFFTSRENPQSLGTWKYRARQSRTWTATCKKTIRRTRG